MANTKINSNNYDNKLNEWKNNIGTTRTDLLYFITSELNSTDIQQLAWKKNLLINITNIDDFTSKVTFVDVLN